MNELELDLSSMPSDKEELPVYTIEQVKDMRRELESKLVATLYAFERNTGLTITNIHLLRENTISLRRSSLLGAMVTVELQ
jgi:hypothetical protein